jgi:ribonuclease III
MWVNPLKCIKKVFSRFSSKNDRKKSLSRLERILGYSFKDIWLLETALSHRSYINDNDRDETGSNERLEFLGDAVLDMLVSEYLYRDLPSAAEGELTRKKSAIVSRKSLATKGKSLGLRDFLLYAKEAFPPHNRGIDTIISNSLEAVIGAVYLDNGIEAARKFIHRHFFDHNQSELSFDSLQEAKNRLLHLTQVQYRCQPNYRIVETTGPEHAKQFHCEVSVRGKVCGCGEGQNKKEAEKQAAQNALYRLPELDLEEKT